MQKEGLKVVLTNKEGEGFEAWRALVNKYETTSKARVVRKLAGILRTPFEGDHLDATAFERKIMIHEAQSRETISDFLKISCVIAGMGQSSMKEHLLLSAKCDSWSNFVREVAAIEHAKKTISAPTPMEIDAFQGVCHKCEKHTDTLPKSVGVRSKEEQRNINARNAEKDIMDNVGREATHQQTESYRKEDGRWQKKETAREHRSVASPRAEKVEPKGKVKEKRKKGQRLNELREPPEEQWASGSWEQWSEQSWQTEADGASWRETDDWSAYTAESGSQASAAEEFQHASFGELRLSNFGAASRIEAFQLDRLDLLTEPSHLALTLHAKLLLLPISLRRAGT